MKLKPLSLTRFALASICSVLFAAPSFVGAANIVVNPGFESTTSGAPMLETSTLDNWTVGEILGTGGPLQNRVDGLNSTAIYGLAPHGGNIVAAFNSNTNTITTGGLATLTQTLTTAAAQAYQLSFWLANPIQDISNLNNIFSVSWNGVALALSNANLTAAGSNTYIVAPNTGWFQVTASVVGTGSDVLTFSARNSDFATLLDDVSVEAKGVPDNGSTLLLFGVALVGLFVAARRTQGATAA